MNEPLEERRRRARETAHQAGAMAFLGSDAGTLRWLTGQAPEIEWGDLPWSAGVHLLLVGHDAAVVCPGDEAETYTAVGLAAYPYEAFSLVAELTPGQQADLALRHALHDAGLAAGDRIAVEALALPSALHEALGEREVVDVTRDIRLARMPKDETELEAIRRAVAMASAGQRAFRERVRPGVTEIALWSEVHGAMEQAAGTRVPVLADLVSGQRCAEVGGSPTGRTVARGEAVLCDLAPRYAGYWGDSCVTIGTGAPSPQLRRLHDVACRALDVGIELARPGVVAGDLDARVRGVMAEAGYSYPHHTGHGVGLSPHEEPRIVPGGTAVLEEGMVLALEPGAYLDDMGLRVEYVIIVRPGGGEVLGEYSLRLT